MDEFLLEKFASQLEDGFNLLGRLRDLSEDEKKALIKCDYSSLDQVISKRESILNDFQRTTREIEGSFKELVKMLDKNISSIFDLSRYVGEPYSSFFKKYPRKYHDMVNSVQERNVHNLLVLNYCKEMVYNLLCNVANKLNPERTYTSNGKLNSSCIPSFITNKM
jgi:flagellar biosynthesis/type III secretory pathway chaperone